jgi:hypothetical protein
MCCSKFVWDSSRYNWIERELGIEPRSCSVCGSLHLDDALFLIEKYGWRIKVTPHKTVFMLKHIKYDDIPPVVVNTLHMGTEQARRFNECFVRQRGLN